MFGPVWFGLIFVGSLLFQTAKQVLSYLKRPDVFWDELVFNKTFFFFSIVRIFWTIENILTDPVRIGCLFHRSNRIYDETYSTLS